MKASEARAKFVAHEHIKSIVNENEIIVEWDDEIETAFLVVVDEMYLRIDYRRKKDGTIMPCCFFLLHTINREWLKAKNWNNKIVKQISDNKTSYTFLISPTP